VNRAEIVESISNQTGLTKTEVSVVFEGILKLIEEELAHGGTVELRRFGTFRCVARAARRAVNPRTGEPIEVGRRTIPSFKPSPKLRQKVAHVKLKRI